VTPDDTERKDIDPFSMFVNMRELSKEEYRAIAFRRLQSLATQIMSGERPEGQINLFSTLETDVMYPPSWLAESLRMQVAREWEQLVERSSQDARRSIRDYTWIVSIRTQGKTEERATVIITFAPALPDTTQRVFSPTEE
jgi:hypothetical protein